MNEETAFLDAIHADPSDHFLRLVYADWLEERGDLRHEYLRLDVRLQELIEESRYAEHAPPEIAKLRRRLKRLEPQIDPIWRQQFDQLRAHYVACRACGKKILSKDAIDTHPVTQRKMKTNRYCKLCWEDSIRLRYQRSSGSYEDLQSNRRRFDYHGGRGDDD